MNALDQWRVAARWLIAMRSQWWSAERVRQHQEIALVRMMQHALAFVPFYQRLRLAPESITTAADLKRFPVVNKRDIQRDPEAFLTQGSARERLYASRTSGSSGQPTTTYFDRDAWLFCKYVLKLRRVTETAGLPLLRRVLIVSEQKPEALAALDAAAPSVGRLFPRRYLSIHLPMEQHLAVLTHYRPHVVYAYPSYLLDLIATAERSKQVLPPIEILYTSSEVLSSAARERIETAFRGKLHDVYGSTEFKEVAWQCEHGRYHVNFESVYVEPQQADTEAPVVLSTLCNYAMPLLRFDIGDRAVFGARQCACGRASPHMLSFAGREGDVISLPSGRRLSPYLLTTVVEAEDSILQYRIVQTAADAFRIDAMVRSPGDSAAWRDSVVAALERVVAEPATFTVHEVDALQRAPSGKRSVFLRSQLDAV